DHAPPHLADHGGNVDHDYQRSFGEACAITAGCLPCRSRFCKDTVRTKGRHEMQTGLSIASHSGLAPAAVGAVAALAEEAGVGAVFVAEGHGDALALCHPVAAARRR